MQYAPEDSAPVPIRCLVVVIRSRKRDLPRVGCAVPISLWMVQKCRLFRPGQGPPQIA